MKKVLSKENRVFARQAGIDWFTVKKFEFGKGIEMLCNLKAVAGPLREVFYFTELSVNGKIKYNISIKRVGQDITLSICGNDCYKLSLENIEPNMQPLSSGFKISLDLKQVINFGFTSRTGSIYMELISEEEEEKMETIISSNFPYISSHKFKFQN